MKQKIKPIAASFLLMSFILLLSFSYGAGFVHGQVDPPACDPLTQEVDPSSGDCVLRNPASGQLVDLRTFPELIERVIDILLGVAAAIAVIFLIIGGFKYVTSHGNEEEMESAKKTVKSAIIGLVIILMSFALVVIVTNLINNPPS